MIRSDVVSVTNQGVTTIEELTPVKKKLSFEIAWDDVKKELDAAYESVGKSTRIKGFRPGKTPRKILEMHFKERAEGEAITNIISRCYTGALQDNKIIAVDHPTIDQNGIVQNANFVFTAVVETQPEFEPEGYVGIEAEREIVEVAESDVEQRLEEIRNMMATLEEVGEDRGVAEGDHVLLDFQVSVEGETRADLTTKDYMFQVGSRKLIPEFEEKIVGIKKGETKEVEITFPENYDAENLAGRAGTFTVTIKDIRKKVLPPLDESFLKNFEKFESLEDFRKNIRLSLEEEGKMRIESAFRNRLIDAILERNSFDVPSAWVERQIQYMVFEMQQRMIMNGMKHEKASEIAFGMKDRFKEQATKTVRTTVLLSRIAEKESLSVDESDIEEALRSIAARYGRDYESVRKNYADGDTMLRLRDEILEKKALHFVEEKAVVKEVKMSAVQPTAGEKSE